MSVYNDLLEWAKEDLNLARQGRTAPAKTNQHSIDYLAGLIKRAENAQGWNHEDQALLIKDLRDLLQSGLSLSSDPEDTSKFASEVIETIMDLLEVYDLKTGN